MSEAEFWDSTPRYFFARQDAEIKKQQREMEVARFLAFYTIKPYDSDNKYKAPKDVCIFEWDDDGAGGRVMTLEEEFLAITPEQWAKFNEEADAFLEKVQNGEHSAT